MSSYGPPINDADERDAFGRHRRYGQSSESHESNNRRRRRQYDDSDDRQHYKRQRHSYHQPRRPHQDRGSIRDAAQKQDQLLRRMRDCIASVGDRLDQSEEQDGIMNDLEAVVRTLDPDFEENVDRIVQLVVACGGQLSMKTSIYGTLTKLLDNKREGFAEKVIAKSLDELQRSLNTIFDDLASDEASNVKPIEEFEQTNLNVFNRIRLLVRFVGELVNANVVGAEDYVFFLDTLQSICVQDHTQEGERINSFHVQFNDFFARVVMESLLFTGATLYEGARKVLQSLLSRCEEYMQLRNSAAPGSFRSWIRLNLIWKHQTPSTELDEKIEKMDRVGILWHIIQDLQKEQVAWEISAINKPYKHFREDFQASKPLQLKTPTVGSVFNKLLRPPVDPAFSLFDDESGEIGSRIAELPVATAYIGRLYVEDILDIFNPSIPETAKQLLTESRVLSTQHFVGKDQEKIQGEYLMMETLFMRMFSPRTKNHAFLPFICGVILQLVKMDPRMISSVLSIVVELIFRRLDEMNVAAIDVFVEWFAHFLSNFEYKWPWDHWNYVLEAEADDPQRLFLSTVIEKCCRLSYLKHMVKVLPESWHVLLPPPPLPCVRFVPPKEEGANPEDEMLGMEEEARSPELRQLFEEATGLFKTRVDNAELQKWLTDKCSNHERYLRFELLWSALLSSGAATLSHTRLLVEKYASFFVDSFNEEEDQLFLLQISSGVWQNSPQHMSTLYGWLLRTGIVRVPVFAKWLFTEDVVQQFSWPYVWQLLDETIATSSFFVSTAETKLKTLAKQLDGPQPMEGDEKEESKKEQPTEAQKQQLDEQLQQLKEERSTFLLKCIDGFVAVITEHVKRCEEEGNAYQDCWYESTLGRFHHFFQQFRVELDGKMDEIQSIMCSSTSSCGPLEQLYDSVVNSH